MPNNFINDLTNIQQPITYTEVLITIISQIQNNVIDIFVNNEDKKNALISLQNIKLNNTVHINKIHSAINIFNYIKSIIDIKILTEYNIQKVYWTYRAKPNNIDKKNPSDIIIELNNNKYIGFSLKSCILTQNADKINNITKQPKINSTLNKFFKDVQNTQPAEYIQIKNYLNNIFKPYLDNQNICDLQLSDKLKYKLNNFHTQSQLFNQCQKTILNLVAEYIKNNQDIFKKYFIKYGLCILNQDINSNFIAFYVIKGSETSDLAIDITPSNNILNDILNSNIQIEPQKNSKQTINLIFKNIYNEHIYNIQIRTQHGLRLCGIA